VVARLLSPSHIIAIDLADSRQDAAKRFGGDVAVNNSREDALAAVIEFVVSVRMSPSRRSVFRARSSSPRP